MATSFGRCKHHGPLKDVCWVTVLMVTPVLLTKLWIILCVITIDRDIWVLSSACPQANGLYQLESQHAGEKDIKSEVNDATPGIPLVAFLKSLAVTTPRTSATVFHFCDAMSPSPYLPHVSFLSYYFLLRHAHEWQLISSTYQMRLSWCRFS